MFDKKINERYLNTWKAQVAPLLKKKDYVSAKFEADTLIEKLLSELGYVKIAYKFWKLK
jgi:hypothetical protein